jgi:hypothetical protein
VLPRRRQEASRRAPRARWRSRAAHGGLRAARAMGGRRSGPAEGARSRGLTARLRGPHPRGSVAEGDLARSDG